MDFNSAHSNPAEEFHYHGTPYDYYQNTLQIDGTAHSPLVGYAADGFPMYYKYVYSDPMDPQSSISELTSGYTLKTGMRSGDGITAPDGTYDGLYVQDYEYTNTTGPLDDCNGRFGITPEYPQGTYYYVVTDNWPYFPRCFYGTVIDNSFRIGPGCPTSTAEVDCSPSTASVSLLEGLTLEVYPNPAGHSVSIKSESLLSLTQVSIYNKRGEVLFNSSTQLEDIDISSWPAGSYFIQITSGKQEVTRKLIKQ